MHVPRVGIGQLVVAHCSWENIQMKNVPQLISSYIKSGQPVADCTLISSDDLFFRDQLGFMKF